MNLSLLFELSILCLFVECQFYYNITLNILLNIFTPFFDIKHFEYLEYYLFPTKEIELKVLFVQLNETG